MMRLLNTTDDVLLGTNFTGVTALDLGASNRITHRGLSAIRDVKLDDLDLANCRSIDDDAVEIVAGIPTLRSLHLDCCNCITDLSILALKRLPSLRELTVRWCYDLTDKSCDALSAMTLEAVALAGLSNITDYGLDLLSKNATLEVLELPAEENFTDIGLRAIAAGRMPLRELTVWGQSAVTDDGFVALAKIHTLRRLTLAELPLITIEGFEYLKRQRPDIEIIGKPWPATA